MDSPSAYNNTVRSGYARVSGRSQDHQLQLDTLAAAGCRDVIVEPTSPLGERPELRAAQERLGLTVATGEGRLLSLATVQRVLAATSSFFEWSIAAEAYGSVDNPMQKGVDPALRRVRDRHQPFVGAASRSSRCGARSRCGYRSGYPPMASE